MKIKWDRPILPAVLAVILTVLLAGCGLTDLKKTSEELKTLVLEQAEGLMGEAEEETQEEERKADRKSSDKDTDSSQEQEAGETEEPAEEAERMRFLQKSKWNILTIIFIRRWTMRQSRCIMRC